MPGKESIVEVRKRQANTRGFKRELKEKLRERFPHQQIDTIRKIRFSVEGPELHLLMQFDTYVIVLGDKVKVRCVQSYFLNDTDGDFQYKFRKYKNRSVQTLCDTETSDYKT